MGRHQYTKNWDPITRWNFYWLVAIVLVSAITGGGHNAQTRWLNAATDTNSIRLILSFGRCIPKHAFAFEIFGHGSSFTLTGFLGL